MSQDERRERRWLVALEQASRVAAGRGPAEAALILMDAADSEQQRLIETIQRLREGRHDVSEGRAARLARLNAGLEIPVTWDEWEATHDALLAAEAQRCPDLAAHSPATHVQLSN